MTTFPIQTFGHFAALLLVAGTVHAVRAAPVLNAAYDPANGNITLVSLDDTSGQPVSLSIATFQFISPGLLLSGSAALVPPSAASFATVLNTAVSTAVSPPSVHGEIYVTNFGGGTPLFTGSWNLGNVAATGLTQSQIGSGFTTTGDPDIIAGGPYPGRFIYQVQGSPSFFAGQITAVPEPSGIALAALGSLALAANQVRRRLTR